ncbi:acetylesterase [Cellulomonas endophytica]|uniref:acetylesterase n=1 Tax=Cellulomonas endophytica TaxID=2494735 RepID=UPI001F0CB59D|nr:acetylesterase [Cellulomonas endophytica]
MTAADPAAGRALPDPLAGYEDWPSWVRGRPRHRPGDPAGDALAQVLGVPAPGPRPAVRTVAAERRDGLRHEVLEWSTGFGPATRAHLVRPDTDDAVPGVLGLHCHGGAKSSGGDQLAAEGPGRSAGAARLQRDLYGDRAPAVALARRGVAVLCPDAFAWGSRRFPLVQRTPRLVGGVAALEALWREQGVEPDDDERYDRVSGLHEDLVAKAAGMFGTSLAGTVAHDDLVALDVLGSLDGVAPDRLGAFGFSGGGGRSVLLGALAPGLRAHVVTCMMATFGSLVPRYLDTHSWLLCSPGLWDHADWPDVLPLRPGRRVLVQYGRDDALFPPAGMAAAHEQLERRAADLPDAYRAAWWDRPHVFDRPMQDEAFDFLVGALWAPPPSGRSARA